MLTLTEVPDLRELRPLMARAGFDAVEVFPADDGTWELHGITSHRENEWGSPDNIGEEDRATVEAVIAELGDRKTKAERARELRDKPVMTQTELTEAVKLLLGIVLEE